ncbi:DUF4123 domain-containing protein [Pseudomonas sp. GCM10022186]|uniref:DUF4123 domain-containing protein n=1 Tax=Pseudomonas sp. GCM10022186 TaxID=3252650 RepID=UPI00361CF6CC
MMLNSPHTSTHTYYLFDGALLLGTPQLPWLLEQPGRHRLYEDLGEQAANVGPWLPPATAPLHEFTRGLLSSALDQRFACSGLVCQAPLPELLEHLRALRYLEARNGQRYYFRYADGRAFSDVWQALTPGQQDATLGPIEAWHHSDRSGLRSVRAQPRPTAEASLPLQLHPRQWHELIESGRIGELFDAACRADQSLPPQGQARQRYTWTQQTYAWLHRLKVDALSVQVAAILVIWRTAGLLLKEEQFEAALRRAQRTGDISHVLAFASLGTGRPV